MKQEEKTRRTRQRILETAVAEFGEKGYAGASLNAVCAAGGVSKGLLYHNYYNKFGQESRTASPAFPPSRA